MTWIHHDVPSLFYFHVVNLCAQKVFLRDRKRCCMMYNAVSSLFIFSATMSWMVHIAWCSSRGFTTAPLFLPAQSYHFSLFLWPIELCVASSLSKAPLMHSEDSGVCANVCGLVMWSDVEIARLKATHMRALILSDTPHLSQQAHPALQREITERLQR